MAVSHKMGLALLLESLILDMLKIPVFIRAAGVVSCNQEKRFQVQET